ncbi:hypothetical protein MIR68_004250 [Amoeboaphelidium protococcarum]|nr:hypothetical protein MIR68_004250 [Amoeboaphelidium protococcarum]
MSEITDNNVNLANSQQSSSSGPQQSLTQQGSSSTSQRRRQIPSCILCDKPAEFMCPVCGPEYRYCSLECQKKDWPTHAQICKDPVAVDPMYGQSQPADMDPDDPRDLAYFINQVAAIINPVLACIFLSIVWVKISLMGSDYRPQRSNFGRYVESPTDSLSQKVGGGLENALIILAQIVVATILFVVLFKYGCFRILYGYLFLTVVALLGFMSYLLALNLIQVFAIPLDYVTLMFFLWNFSAGGIIAIFGGHIDFRSTTQASESNTEEPQQQQQTVEVKKRKTPWAPLYIQQLYLVIMSSLMAFALTGLDSWTTWALLAILAIWDLIAVLCPYGPLKVLIESSRQQNRDVPALLYSVTMLYFMVDTEDNYQEKNQSQNIPLSIRSQDSNHSESSNLIQHPHAVSQSASSPLTSVIGSASPNTNTASVPIIEDRIQLPQRRRSSQLNIQNPENADSDDIEQIDEEQSGLKLGLGDFVFYSVLIARTSSTSDWITTMACIIAILTGLTMTIFLLAVYKKALPALPISIAFGLLFYFVGSTTLSPFINYVSMRGIIL